jgi:hypothetical protein
MRRPHGPGVDFSAAQLHRARRLVPDARLVQADMATVQFGAASLDAQPHPGLGVLTWSSLRFVGSASTMGRR